MTETNGKNAIVVLQKKWNAQIRSFYIFFMIALLLLAVVVSVKLFHLLWVILPIFFIVSLLVNKAVQKNTIDENDVVRFLNKTYPELQESVQLITKPVDGLSVLERLQRRKTEAQLQENMDTPQSVKKRIKILLILSTAFILFSGFLFVIPVSFQHHSVSNTSVNTINPVRKPEVKLPEIKAVTVTVKPPVYTHKKERQQSVFAITAEEKAMISWYIITTAKANEVQLLFNDKTVLRLQSANTQQTQWTGNKLVLKPGFYQVKIDDKLSELYQVETIRDVPPVITVQSPGSSTLIRLGEAKKCASMCLFPMIMV